MEIIFDLNADRSAFSNWFTLNISHGSKSMTLKEMEKWIDGIGTIVLPFGNIDGGLGWTKSDEDKITFKDNLSSYSMFLPDPHSINELYNFTIIFRRDPAYKRQYKDVRNYEVKNGFIIFYFDNKTTSAFSLDCIMEISKEIA